MKEILLASILLAHSWYPPQCCSDSDCKPIECHEVTKEGDRLYWNGKSGLESIIKKPSPDEKCHICDGPTFLRCFFYVVPAT